MDERDRSALSELVAAYCQSYDDRDGAGLAATIHPDCRLRMEGGTFDGKVVLGREAAVAWLSETWDRTPPCLHLTGNARFRTDGSDAVGAVDYVLCLRQGPGVELAGWGRYLDRYRRHDGRWVLWERIVRQPAPPPEGTGRE